MSGAGASKLSLDEIPKGDSSYAIAYRQFRKDRVAVGALFALVLVACVAVFSPLLANSKPVVASYQGELHFPAFTDYLDENIPIPFGIPSRLRRSLPGVFSPKYPEIKRPAWQQVPDWRAIRREIDSTGEGWYLSAPVPWYYKENTSGIKLLPGRSIAHLELGGSAVAGAETLEFVPGRPPKQEWDKVRGRLGGGEVHGEILFDEERLAWYVADATQLAVGQAAACSDWVLDETQRWPTLRSPEEGHAGRLTQHWEWREAYLPAGQELVQNDRVLARAFAAWERSAPKALRVKPAGWTVIAGLPAALGTRRPTEEERERLIGPEATSTTVALLFAEDRVFTVALTAPVALRPGKGHYQGHEHDALWERVVAAVALQEPSGQTTVNAVAVRGRRFLRSGDALGLSGVQGEFVQLPAFSMGSDNNGRCVLSRLIHGTVIAGSVGVVSVGIYVVIGVIVGALAGYFRGWVDMLISRLIEIVICFPTLFLIILVVAIMQSPSIYLIMIALGLIRWTGVARLVRGEFLKVMSADYVSAAKALGLPTWRIILRHVLPNAISPVFVSASFGVAGAILIESSLSFLGFGVAPPTASWGEILRQGRDHVNEGLYHLIWAPGFCIFFTVTMFNLVGEGMRDALDPKLRR